MEKKEIKKIVNHMSWGVLFLFLYFRKTVGIRQIFESNRKMTGKSFWKILCVFLGIQLVLELGFMMLERGLNIIGFSLMSSMEEASMNEETFFMLLYAAVIAPVSEELVYRGFVMSSIKKYGKVFAIVVSSVLFGVMHGNLPQALFACMV